MANVTLSASEELIAFFSVVYKDPVFAVLEYPNVVVYAIILSILPFFLQQLFKFITKKQLVSWINSRSLNPSLGSNRRCSKRCLDLTQVDGYRPALKDVPVTDSIWEIGVSNKVPPPKPVLCRCPAGVGAVYRVHN
jgi:hypothetical protein